MHIPFLSCLWPFLSAFNCNCNSKAFEGTCYIEGVILKITLYSKKKTLKDQNKQGLGVRKLHFYCYYYKESQVVTTKAIGCFMQQKVLKIWFKKFILQNDNLEWEDVDVVLILFFLKKKTWGVMSSRNQELEVDGQWEDKVEDEGNLCQAENDKVQMLPKQLLQKLPLKIQFPSSWWH